MKVKVIVSYGYLFRDASKEKIYELTNEQLRGILAAADFVYDKDSQPLVTIYPVNVKIPLNIYNEIQDRKDINASKDVNGLRYQLGIRKNNNDRYNYYNFKNMEFLQGFRTGLDIFLIDYRISNVLKNTTYKDLE